MSFLKWDTDLNDLFKATLQWNYIAGNMEPDANGQRAALQHACLVEEVQELRDALDASDEVETLDALCDILFVAIFAHYLTDDSKPTLELDHEFIDAGYTAEDLYTQLEGLLESRQYLTMVQLVLRTSYLFKFDIKGAYNNVVTSNFSKFPLEDSLNGADTLQWFEEEYKYVRVVGSIISGRWVFRCNDGMGKVVKPPQFNEPELLQFIFGSDVQ